MKNVIITLACAGVVALSSCSKSNNNNVTPSDNSLEGQVLVDFPANLANPNYLDIETKAGIMNDAVAAFVSSSTDANLTATQTAWRNTRAAWESCEGFLFGPVEDNNYDPTMDTWPVNRVDFDNLLASNNTLTLTEVDKLDPSLKGFHAIEYIIFGVGGTRKAADITAREKTYLSSLTQSVYNTTKALHDSWDPSSGNFTAQVVNAGKSTSQYKTRLDLFKALVGAMADICDEVANSKMNDPLVKQDSTQDESQFSHNSVADFTNNIKGIANAYYSTYNYAGAAAGHSLSQIVKAKNASLDTKIQTQIAAAVASFDVLSKNNITYEKAIYKNQAQVKAIQATINTLHDTLDGDLNAFIIANIKD